MLRVGDALSYIPATPVGPHTHIVGLYIAAVEDCYVLAVPAGASVGGRTYQIAAADRIFVACQFV